jgi:proline iminopeptidase
VQSPQTPLFIAVLACALACGAPSRPVTPTAGAHDIVTSDGARLAVHVAGHGPTCLFIHGGPGQDTLSFEQMGGNSLEAFATMIYVDQRGSGRSPDVRDYGLARVVQDFDEVRQQLGVDKLCLVAHSFGGILAVSYALRYPQHVSSLVMANTTLQFLGPTQARMQIAFVNELLAARGLPPIAIPSDPAGLAAAHDEAFAQAVQKTDQQYRMITVHVENVKRMNELERSYPRSLGYGQYVLDQHRQGEYYEDYAPRSAEITAPVLILTSRLDRAVGPDEYKRFRFPHASVVELPGGHMSYADDTDAFAEAIHRFLMAHPD